MTKKSGLIAAAWALSCGSAFLIGRTTTPSADEGELSANQPTASTRSSARRAGTRGAGEKKDPANASRGASFSNASSSSIGKFSTLEEQVRALKDLSDPMARAEGFLDLVRNLSPDEYLTAIDEFRKGGIDEEQFGEYRLLLTAWAKVDPLEALDYAKEKTGTAYARQTILAAWAKNDTEGAVAWARENFDATQTDNRNRERANPWLVGVISGIASTDVNRATQLLEELPYSRGRGDALEAVFKEVTAGGNEDAKRWIAQLKDSQLQEGAASRLAGRIAQDDPEAAADWATSLGPKVLERSAEIIVDQWAGQDLGAARAWVDSQESDVAAAAGPSLVSQMVDQGDLSTATAWLGNHVGDPAFDDSIVSLVWGSMREEPTFAADWIMQISSPQDQARTFHRVLGGWMERDRDAAIQYIQNNEVPESIARRAGVTK